MRKKSTKIFLVSNTSWYLWNFRYNLMKTLKRKGYNIYGIAPEDNYSIKIKKEFKFIPIKHLHRKSTNPVFDLRLILELYKIYITLNPDLILHYTIKPNIYGGIAASILNKKYINTITGLGYLFTRNNFLKKLGIYLYKISSKKANFLIFQNFDDYNLFIKENISNQLKMLVIKGSGIDTSKFHPDFCNKFTEKNTEKVSFLFLGRLLYDKGVKEFIEASNIVKSKYPNTLFYLLGPIDKSNPAAISKTELHKWEKQNTITYLGTIDDVRKYICKSDVIVLPSYREGIPRSLLEAMAMEKPIITTDSVGCKDTVENGKNGILIPVKNVSALANAMITMIELDEKKRKKMGQHGRKKVIEEFDEKIIIGNYIQIIKKIL